MTKLLIGIDPGSNCGVATLDPISKQLLLYQFNSNIEAMFFCLDLKDKYDITMYIEDARLVRKSKHFAQKADVGRLQGVGYVKGFSKEWEAFTRLLKIRATMLARGQTKVSVEYFKGLTGIDTLKSESHKRDAAMIIIGRTH